MRGRGGCFRKKIPARPEGLKKILWTQKNQGLKKILANKITHPPPHKSLMVGPLTYLLSRNEKLFTSFPYNINYEMIGKTELII